MSFLKIFLQVHWHVDASLNSGGCPKWFPIEPAPQKAPKGKRVITCCGIWCISKITEKPECTVSVTVDLAPIPLSNGWSNGLVPIQPCGYKACPPEKHADSMLLSKIYKNNILKLFIKIKGIWSFVLCFWHYGYC